METAKWEWKINDRVYAFQSADRAPAENGTGIIARLRGITAVDGDPRTPYDAEIPMEGTCWHGPQLVDPQ